MTRFLSEFGGYLPLELPPAKSHFYESNAEWTSLPLNSGRATFSVAARQLQMETVWLPYFTCEETQVPFLRLGLNVKKYSLTERLLPKNVNLRRGEALLWTNYYGNARADEITEVVSCYSGSLIIDNCHAFFSPPQRGALSSYSTRKFFGVSDGAYLVGTEVTEPPGLEKGVSYDSAEHLLRQLDQTTHAGYQSNLANEERLSDAVMKMSNLTSRILETIDYGRIEATRRANFQALDEKLRPINTFPLNRDSKTHMYYPLQLPQENLRNKLIANRIYSPFWWRHVLDEVPRDSVEARLSKEVVLLPIDQRYDHHQMEHLAGVVMALLD